MSSDCPFCSVSRERVFWSGSFCLALTDAYPVSRGHSLIVPRRHVRTWSDGTTGERAELLTAIDQVRHILDAKHSPDGYNIGINDGVAAGQTVMHLHVHVIPRYQGDVRDPRGGVRWVISERANYWEKKEG